MISEQDKYLAHYGILRKSGRYPWGSGGSVNTRSKTFLDYVEDMRSKGLTDPEIARGVGMTTTEFRNTNTLARNARKQADIARAYRLKEKGHSNVAIGELMGINESSVRSLLKPGEADKLNVLHKTADMLREAVERFGVIDVGKGLEHNSAINVARNKLDTAIAILRNEGYAFHKVQVDQAGTSNKTTIKVLAKPEYKGQEGYRTIKKNLSLIKLPGAYTEDGGRSYSVIKPPLSLSSKRVKINYKEDGGDKADGVIYVREGKTDLSLGKSRYAQVRIAVDGTHYIKGMAMYKDDLPPGADVVFNTNKSKTEAPTKLDALKELKKDSDGDVDPLNPFGSIVRQIGDRDETGDLVKVTSVMNLVNEQGDWEKWQDALSSQMLSKQRPLLAKQQLDLAYEQRKNALDEISALTNPAVKKTLLEGLADEADSAAVQLKAHALPKQGNFVILPINSMKETEVYAPRYNHGERVVLIRHPHGGTFEIPELVVNNRHPEAKRLLGEDPPDAIGINTKVAERLSGADFDGDTVLVIPNTHAGVATKAPLQGLKGFDPKAEYPAYEGMKPMSPSTKQKEMGVVSNLITDMTIRGATDAELARAVRHSMVVIDAEKHTLNYKLSAEVNGISALKAKYQTPYQETGRAGASTLISRAKSRIDVPDRPFRPASKGGKIDPATGKIMYDEPKTFTTKDGKVVTKMKRSVKLKETDDAHTLSSGHVVEKVYADHSNRLKALANTARKEMVNTKPTPYDPRAAKTYDTEVRSLVAKLKLAESNAPKERQAQVLANAALYAKKAANPHMDAAEEKKTQALLIAEMRARMGAKKTPVYIDDREWEAIQAGAITNHRLSEILKHSDKTRVKELATPRARTVMTSVKQRRAESLLSTGLTQNEVAEILGVSLTTLRNSFKKED